MTAPSPEIAKVVAWLREDAVKIKEISEPFFSDETKEMIAEDAEILEAIADAIERGEHLKGETS